MTKLNQQQRFFVALTYVVLITVIFISFGGTLSDIVDDTTNIGIWFCSGALLIIFGIYITEPFYSKPVDTITNGTAVLLSLFALPNKNALMGYWFILGIIVFLLVCSFLTIFFKDKDNKFLRVIHFIVMNLGNARFVFTPFYLLSAYSFFSLEGKHSEFVLIALLWVFLCVFDPISWLVRKIKLFKRTSATKDNFVGFATQCSSPEIYTVESSYECNTPINTGDIVAIQLSTQLYKIGVIAWEQDLLSGRFIEIQCFDFGIIPNRFSPESLGILRYDKLMDNQSVYSVVLLNVTMIDPAILKLIKANFLHQNICNLVGRVLTGSTIDIVKFSINNPLLVISEGQIVYTQIQNEIVLYQVINGITAEEVLDRSNHSAFLCCYARKLGKYEEDQLKIVKWVPSASEPVFILSSSAPAASELKTIAASGIGRLPETTKRILVQNIDELITHNTAILGILGVGKSCLAYELIQKITQSNKKVVCIDITNQYYSPKGLPLYVDINLVTNDLSAKDLDDLKLSYKTRGTVSNAPEQWGNESKYRQVLFDSLKSFYESDKMILVLNPDNHFVGKAASQFSIQSTVELSPAEKTRIISEQLLDLFEDYGQSENAKCLLVYEEAHSLIPEWNSVANDGDKAAANGTARVIMQGRKFGLGCFVITQRTANVTKSILNQCNTVFAMRIFDDTGKTFLENYIGSYYSSILPTLEERHAIAIGRGLGLKQPVIIQLNNMKHIIRE
jgi:hypothetical protein